MSREFGGPSPDEMGIAKDKSPEAKAKLLSRVMEIANKPGNKVGPDLLEAMGNVLDSKDPVLMDAMDPDSQTNQKNLSPEARKKLDEAWNMLIPAEEKRAA